MVEFIDRFYYVENTEKMEYLKQKQFLTFRIIMMRKSINYPLF